MNYTCVEFAKKLFSEPFLNYMRKIGITIQDLLVSIGCVCKNIDCEKHVYYGFFSNNSPSKPNWNSEYGKECMFCMCCVEKPASEETIAELYGLSRVTISKYSGSGLNKLRKGVIEAGLK